jgi:glutathione S-transferase
MSEYKLYCFPESGGCFKVAAMLAACKADWEPVFVDFHSGITRDPAWRAEFNELGELPILEHKGKRLTQSGVILFYLAEQLKQYGPRDADDHQEILRWILFDNHKFTAFFVIHRFMRCGWLTKGAIPDPNVLAFLRMRAEAAFAIVEKHLANSKFIMGERPTIVDFSMSAYLYYPKEETGFDLPVSHPNLAAWLERLKQLPGWKHPYDMMPGKRARRYEYMQVPE